MTRKKNLGKKAYAEIRKRLLEWWFDSGKREFPWRNVNNPYYVLVSEILLHRTAARQIIPHYKLFIERYPNVQTLAKSHPEELSVIFHSCGLNWRWEMVSKMANELNYRFNGRIPKSYSDLISLPGIGSYVASAVRCFAFGYPDVLLDTNTVRVSGRLFGLKITESSRRNQQFRQSLVPLMSNEYSKEINYALIDLAATICKPKNPSHQSCPVKQFCCFYINENGGNKICETENSSY